jgi:hypothetical protein
VASYPHDGKSTDFLLKVADLRLYQCRSQSAFAATAHRLHPRFAPEDMSVRVEEKGRGETWIAPVVDLSYGGLAFRARRRDKWPPRWKAEILQKHDPEKHPIRLKPMHWAPLPGGAVRVGCAYA